MSECDRAPVAGELEDGAETRVRITPALKVATTASVKAKSRGRYGDALLSMGRGYSRRGIKSAFRENEWLRARPPASANGT
jgi:hypothetical protein